jgi:hypothetical protein
MIFPPILSAFPEVLYSQESEPEKVNTINQKVEQPYSGGYTEALPLAQQIKIRSHGYD